MRILIVEDDKDICLLYHVILEKQGYEISQINENFASLLAIDAWEDIDVAIVDLNLPGILGCKIIDFVKIIKPEIRIIIATAAIQFIDEFTKNADFILGKPFSPVDLITAIEGGFITEDNGGEHLRKAMHRYAWGL